MSIQPVVQIISRKMETIMRVIGVDLNGQTVIQYWTGSGKIIFEEPFTPSTKDGENNQ